MAFEFLKLSASVRGEAIVLVDDGTPGNLIHKALPGVNSMDRVYLYIVHPTFDSFTVGISIGGNGTQHRVINGHSGADRIPLNVLAGIPIRNGVEIRGWTPESDIPEGILAYGYVIRITP